MLHYFKNLDRFILKCILLEIFVRKTVAHVIVALSKNWHGTSGVHIIFEVIKNIFSGISYVWLIYWKEKNVLVCFEKKYTLQKNKYQTLSNMNYITSEICHKNNK